MNIKKDTIIGLIVGLAIALIAFAWWYYAQAPSTAQLPIAAKDEPKEIKEEPKATQAAVPVANKPIVAPTAAPAGAIDSLLSDILRINASSNKVQFMAGAVCLKAQSPRGIRFMVKKTFDFSSYFKGKGFVFFPTCASQGSYGGHAGYFRKSDGMLCSVQWVLNEVAGGTEFNIACEYAI